MASRRPPRTNDAALVAALIVVALALAACSSDAKKAKPTTTTKATTTTKKAAVAGPPVAPLTGLPQPDAAARNRPALEVKIENLPVARPQAGIDVADVVYEEVVDGGITRYLAVFQSTGASKVGPIRSVRPTDPDLVTVLGGIFAYSGGSAVPVGMIKAAPVHSVDESGAGAAMFRDNTKRAPQNLFGDTDRLWALGGTPAPPPALFTYRAAKDKVEGDPVTSITVHYFGCSNSYGCPPTWTWDAASATFRRTLAGVPQNAANGQPIAPTNVIVEFTNYQGGPGAFNSHGVTIGFGVAWVLTDGRIIRGTWSRADAQHPIVYKDAAGKVVKLTPGRTWVELPSTTYTVDVVSPPTSSSSTGGA